MGRAGWSLAAVLLVVTAVVVSRIRPGEPEEPPAPPRTAARSLAPAPVPPTDASPPPVISAAPRAAGDGALLGRLVRGIPPVPLRGSVELSGPAGSIGRAECGEDGRFRVEGLPRGVPILLVARSDGLPEARLPSLFVPVDSALDLGDVPLGPVESVEVRVRDEKNAPLPEASVAIHRWIADQGAEPDSYRSRAYTIECPPPGDPEFRSATDGRGVARFDAVPPGARFVLVSAPGFTTVRENLFIGEGYLRDPVEVRLVRGFPLAGIVTAADGKPAGGVNFRTRQANWSPLGGDQRMIREETTSAADGTYALQGLPVGRNEIWVEPVSGTWYRVASVILPVTGAVDLRIPSSSPVEGRVVDDSTGAPLAGVTVVAASSADPWERYPTIGVRTETATDAEGNFRVEGLPGEDSIGLTVAKEGFLPQERAVTPAEGKEAATVFRLSRGSAIRGRVLLADGTPVPNALVWTRLLRRSDGPFQMDNMGDETRRVRSGPTGEYRIEPAPPGKVVLIATADGLQLPDLPSGLSWGYMNRDVPDSLKLLVPTGGEAEKDLVLRPGAVVSGTVLDGEGKPVPGLALRVGSWPRQDSHQNSAMVPDGEGMPCPTGPDGSFRVVGLLAGTKRFVYAYGRGQLEGWSRTFDLAAGETVAGLEIRVARNLAAIAGTVHWEDGTPAAGALVGLSEQEIEPSSNQSAWGEGTVPVDATGAFRTDDVRPGQYTVFAECRGGLMTPGPRFTIAAHESREGIALVLRRGARIAGRILDTEGRPIAGAAVLVEPVGKDRGDAEDGEDGEDGEEAKEPPESYMYSMSSMSRVNGPRTPVRNRANTTADATGTFLKEGLPGGEYWVSAGAAGHLEGFVRIRAGDPAIEIRLGDSLSISGTTVDAATGKPVAGIPIYLHAEKRLRNPVEPDWTYSGKDGTFTVTDLAPGPFTVNCASHLNMQDLEYDEQDLNGVASGTSGLVVRLVRGLTIAGRVLDPDGVPVAGLSVDIQPDTEEDDRRQRGFGNAIPTGPDGRFRFGGLEAKRYRVTLGIMSTFGVRLEGTRNHEFVGKTVGGIEPGNAEIEFRVERGKPIRGKIVDPDGKPARPHGGSGRVVLDGGDTEPGNEINRTVFADSRTGAFETLALPPGGSYDLHAYGFADTLDGMLRGVKPGETVVIRLSAGQVLSGRVVDDAGQPVREGVRLEARAVDGVGDPGRWEHGKTNEGGLFRFAGLADSRFTITAGGQGSDYLVTETEKPIAAGTTDVVIVLKRGVAISGKLLDAKGKPVRHPDIQVDGSWSRCESQEDGTFRIRGLTPGKKRLTTTAGPDRIEVDLGTYDAPSSDLVLNLPANPQPVERKEDEGE